jgi:serine protease Do
MRRCWPRSGTWRGRSAAPERGAPRVSFPAVTLAHTLRCRFFVSVLTLGALGSVSATGAETAVRRPAAPSDLVHLSASVADLVARARPAVVQVATTSYVAGDAASRGALLAAQRGTGSGVVVSADGYIVTNAHVVEGARRVQVAFAAPGPGPEDPKSIVLPPGRIVGAQVIGVDRESDLAVLKVAESGLPFLAFGDSENLRQGQLVIALGSPLGLEGSVTLGVVSAVARQVRQEDRMVYVQTDAPINPGNSGGPLVDVSGNVVGINSFILSQSGGNEGVGFAAPSNIVRTVFEQIRKAGRVSRGDIGVSAQTVTPALASGLGLNRSWGAVIADVVPNGSADRVGLRTADLVLTLDGKVIENARQFHVNLYPHAVGDTVRLEVLRGAERRTFDVTVAERPGDAGRLADLVTPERNVITPLGILAIDLDDGIARTLGPLRARGGVVVAAAVPGGGAVADPLVPGDVIYSLNQRPVTGLDSLRAALAALAAGAPAVLQVERQGRLRFVSFDLSAAAPDPR